jgi:hypothetical protein
MNPTISFDDERIYIQPLLFNPSDMMEIQAIVSGSIQEISLGGRISNAVLTRRRSLPYPPGSGHEGEMLSFDRFMWYVVNPVIAAGLPMAITVPISMEFGAPKPASIIFILLVSIVSVVLSHWRTRYLVHQRRLWKA